MSMSSSNKLYLDKSSSLPLSSSLLLALLFSEDGSLFTVLEMLLLGAFSSRLLERDSFSLDELDFLARFGDDFFERFRLLLSEEDDDEVLSSLDRERDRDRERDLERFLDRFELSDLLLLLDFFFRRPNSSYSESEDSLSLYSTTPRSL